MFSNLELAFSIFLLVLLILAGVTITALSGDNGILKRATEAKEKTNQKNQEEETKLENYEDVIEQYANGTGGSSGGGTGTDFKNINTADSNPAGVIPAGSTIIENDANKGIVIKDKNNNEWVWVEVPKTTVFSGLTIDTTGNLTDQNYTDIKNKLITYATTYREGKKGQERYWTDEWYNGCGLTSEEYTALYKKMLKSVYTNGGFWIGRYEAGIEGSTTDLSKAITSHTTVTIGISPKAISQKDAIPYNYVYCSEAQALSKEMTPDNSYSSSLMFGIQWDLVCKFIEVKSGLSTADINSDSGRWGIYSNVEKIITSENAKQSTDNGNTWKAITGTKSASSIILSAGASNETNKMNIYDFAGNEWEWTLEKTSNTNNPCAYRSGSYGNTGYGTPAASHNYNGTTSSYDFISFRVALLK